MEAETKKKVLRKLTYGMWVISAAAGDDVEASSITWLMQGSFKPPLVVAGVRADTHLRAVIEKGKAFALHLLSSAHVVRGDHVIFVAEVVDAGMTEDVSPLALATTGWTYGG